MKGSAFHLQFCHTLPYPVLLMREPPVNEWAVIAEGRSSWQALHGTLSGPPVLWSLFRPHEGQYARGIWCHSVLSRPRNHLEEQCLSSPICSQPWPIHTPWHSQNRTPLMSSCNLFTTISTAQMAVTTRNGNSRNVITCCKRNSLNCDAALTGCCWND